MPQPSPNRAVSNSPAAGMNGLPTMQRQSSDSYYMNAMNGGMAAVPAHLRTEMGQTTPRSSSPAQYPMAVNGQQSHRPSLTSNPSSNYGPPQTLEPPTTNGQQQGGSAGNSPHMGAAMGWQSPHHGMTSQQQADYSYPDPNQQYVQQAGNMYYQAQSMQRPHSTGPMDYPNQHPQMWAQHQQ